MYDGCLIVGTAINSATAKSRPFRAHRGRAPDTSTAGVRPNKCRASAVHDQHDTVPCQTAAPQMSLRGLRRLSAAVQASQSDDRSNCSPYNTKHNISWPRIRWCKRTAVPGGWSAAPSSLATASSASRRSSNSTNPKPGGRRATQTLRSGPYRSASAMPGVTECNQGLWNWRRVPRRSEHPVDTEAAATHRTLHAHHPLSASHPDRPHKCGNRPC